MGNTNENLVVLTFRVAQCLCAFRVHQVQEVLAIPATIQVPGQPKIIEGFLNLRGTIVPIVRTATLFHENTVKGLYSPVVIIRASNGTYGLLADEVKSVVTVEEVRPLLPGHTATDYAEGEFTIEGENIVLLDCERLLLAEERQRIAELQSQVAERQSALGFAQ